MPLDQKALHPCKFTSQSGIGVLFFSLQLLYHIFHRSGHGNLTIKSHFWNIVKIQIPWMGGVPISSFQVDGIECFTIMRRKLRGGDVDNSAWLLCRVTLCVKYSQVPSPDLDWVHQFRRNTKFTAMPRKSSCLLNMTGVLIWSGCWYFHGFAAGPQECFGSECNLVNYRRPPCSLDNLWRLHLRVTTYQVNNFGIVHYSVFHF